MLLAFSRAFLLALTIFSLLPERYGYPDAGSVGILIILGILVQIILEFFSKGAEHGHIHTHRHKNGFPWLVFLSLSVHSMLEGFPVHKHHNVLYGIVIHKLPVAVVLITFFLNATVKKQYIVIFMTLFSLMTPLGMLLSEHLTFAVNHNRQFSALAVGIFLHIFTVILFETSEAHQFNGKKFVAIMAGITAAYFL